MTAAPIFARGLTDVYRTVVSPGTPLPVVLTPVRPAVDAAAWADAHRTWIDDTLVSSGAILFRDFGIASTEAFSRFVQAAGGPALDYTERSSPRTQVAEGIYTSTEHPPTHGIFLHHENSYQRVFPRCLFFCCAEPAATGGNTPIADGRQVLREMDPACRDEFERKGWLYVRNFGGGFGLPWSTVFGTTDRAEVEAYCRERRILTEWRGSSGLRLRAALPALTRHPRTGERVWFNHAVFFHVSTLAAPLRRAFEAEYAPDEMPTNTFFGDGSPIRADTLEHLRALYARATVSFPWQRGDVLLLDNMLVAHGRDPFTGPRRILVAMTELVERGDDR